PLGRRRRPGAFDTAGDCIAALAAAEAALPAQPLLFDAGAFRLAADVRSTGRAVALAERMPAGDQRDGFLVVHRHPRKGFADIASGSHRIGLAVRSLGIYIDQAHLHGCERIVEFAFTGVALITEPF